eukprot:5289633-Amphidinium_carterae.1
MPVCWQRAALHTLMRDGVHFPRKASALIGSDCLVCVLHDAARPLQTWDMSVVKDTNTGSMASDVAKASAM